MKKLELKHLAPYLPYGLKVDIHYGLTMNMTWKRNIPANDTENISVEGVLEDFHVKPILRPLSDLTKEIELDGVIFMPFNFLSERLRKNIDILGFPDVNDISVYDYQKLLEWHFDIFGLIEKGLAVDINTCLNK